MVKVITSKDKLVKTILSFIDELNYNVWDLRPGMASSEDILRELKLRGYDVQIKKIGKDPRIMSRFLNKQKKVFEMVKRSDIRVHKKRMFWKRKK